MWSLIRRPQAVRPNPSPVTAVCRGASKGGEAQWAARHTVHLMPPGALLTEASGHLAVACRRLYLRKAAHRDCGLGPEPAGHRGGVDYPPAGAALCSAVSLALAVTTVTVVRHGRQGWGVFLSCMQLVFALCTGAFFNGFDLIDLMLGFGFAHGWCVCFCAVSEWVNAAAGTEHGA